MRFPLLKKDKLAFSITGHIEHAPHIAVPVLLLEEDVPLLHLALLNIPEHPHRGGRGVRDDEGLQAHGGIAEALLDFLDGLVEPDLGVVRPEIPDAYGIHENDMLHAVREQPENKVGVKIAGLEEAHTAALAQIAEQIELPGLEEVGVSVVERLEILDELTLALVERRGTDLDDV